MTYDAPYQVHSDTSKAAATEARSKTMLIRAQVLSYLRTRGSIGCTDEEMQELLGLPQNTQRPRRVELFQRGLIIDSGVRRKTKSGRTAVVWVATP
jgi:predicted transcriptional regulator